MNHLNLLQASKDLKKKLSFDDYTVTPQTSGTEVAVDKEPSGQENSSALVSSNQNSENQNCSTEKVVAETEVISTANSINSKNQAKIKVTHYLTVQDHKALMRVYIKRLQNDVKVDKSALITEALHLLYQKEQV